MKVGKRREKTVSKKRLDTHFSYLDPEPDLKVTKNTLIRAEEDGI